MAGARREVVTMADRTVIAIHEAAHVIVARVHGIPLCYATLDDPDGPLFSYAAPKSTQTQPPLSPSRNFAWPEAWRSPATIPRSSTGATPPTCSRSGARSRPCFATGTTPAARWKGYGTKRSR